MRGRAADELDELSLRHLIGELDEAAWNEARPALERRVADADDAVARARAEVEHLEQLAADIAGAETAAAAPPPLARAGGARGARGDVRGRRPARRRPGPTSRPRPPPKSQPRRSASPPRSRSAEPSIFSAAGTSSSPTCRRSRSPSRPPPAEDATVEAPPADPREAAEAASADEWDPFGNEFSGGAPSRATRKRTCPGWRGSTRRPAAGRPPAADEGLDFLREIEESTRGGRTPRRRLRRTWARTTWRSWRSWTAPSAARRRPAAGPGRRRLRPRSPPARRPPRHRPAARARSRCCARSAAPSTSRIPGTARSAARSCSREARWSTSESPPLAGFRFMDLRSFCTF